MIRAWHVALRSVGRDWRGGELRILALALVVAVAAVSAVTFFTDRVYRAMGQQAAELLAGDLVVVSSKPIRKALVNKAAEVGLARSLIVDFPSVVLAQDETLLVQVKAVDVHYPLRGALRVASSAAASALTTQAIPTAGRVWVDRRVLDGLNLPVGASLKLGNREFVIEHLLEYEPDRGGQLFRLAPRVMLNRADLEGTGLVTANSRVQYRLLVAGSERTVAHYRRWLAKRLHNGEKMQGVREGRPVIRTALERAEHYLMLAALVAVLVAGAAIALTTRHYAERQLDAGAIMRCLGASQRLVFQVYLLRLLLIGLGASLAGCLMGYVAQGVLAHLLAGWFLQEIPPPGFSPVIIGMGTGLLALLGFALPPVLRLREVPPLRVLRRELGVAPPSFWITGAFASLALLALLAWQIGITDMTLKILLGTGACLVVLAVMSLGAILATRWLAPSLRATWRQGLARLHRPMGRGVLQVAGFTVPIMALLVLAVIRVDLLNAWREGLPADAPNHFLINIQRDEIDGLNGLFRAHGLREAVYYPIVRGRLMAINDHAVGPDDYDSPRAKRLVSREFNLTWTDELPPDNTISEGQWWAGSGRARSAFSVEEGIAEGLNITVGDTLHFDIAGSEHVAEVGSLREVDWDSFNPNFFVIASPGLLAEQPANYITSFYLPTAQRSLLRTLAREHASVSALDVGAIIAQLRAIMDRAALVVEYVFLFTVAASLLVLYAAIQASHSERRREIALLRALGASRRQILSALLAEFAGVGLIAGALAALVSSVAAYLVATQVFELVYRPTPWLWIWGIGGGVTVITGAGLLGTYRLLNQAPLYTLQRV